MVIKANKTTADIGECKGFRLQKLANALRIPTITSPAVTGGEVALMDHSLMQQGTSDSSSTVRLECLTQ